MRSIFGMGARAALLGWWPSAKFFGVVGCTAFITGFWHGAMTLAGVPSDIAWLASVPIAGISFVGTAVLVGSAR